MIQLGLLGRNISYSFSRAYFKNKFETENINNVNYQNFDIQSIDEFPSIIKNTKNLKGMNVTIPYKQDVMAYLDEVDNIATEIGAVNTIKVNDNGKLIGYNTDYYGFSKSLEPLLKPYHKSALILGTGGASKAVAYSLKHLGIEYHYVSRTKSENVTFGYEDLTETIITNHKIIINCTPLGTFPNTENCPDIPYNGITNEHILFDLIYNPEETKFLALGKQKNATVTNGLLMLKLQAEKSWSIWKIKEQHQQ